MTHIHGVSMASYDEKANAVSECTIAKFDNYDDANWLARAYSLNGCPIYHWFNGDNQARIIGNNREYDNEYAKIVD